MGFPTVVEGERYLQSGTTRQLSTGRNSTKIALRLATRSNYGLTIAASVMQRWFG